MQEPGLYFSCAVLFLWVYVKFLSFLVLTTFSVFYCVCLAVDLSYVVELANIFWFF